MHPIAPINLNHSPGRSWQERLDGQVRMMALMVLGPDTNPDPQAAADFILSMARMALQPTSEIPTRFTNRMGDGVAAPCITGPGVLRLAFENEGLDWSDPFVAERIMVVVQRALDDEFRRPNPGVYAPGEEPWG